MQKHSSSRVKQQRVYKNDEIKAFKVLVIDEEGNQLGLMPRAKALSMAEESGLDLVQLSYDATQQVSTAKLVDYGRYMYDKKKTEQEKKQRQQAKEQKEIKFGYTIGHNDLDLKIKKVAEFLDNGHVVRVSVVLK